MGILADFFVASPEDARRYASPDSVGDTKLREQIAPAEWKGFTPLELGTLWAILEGQDWNIKRHWLIEELLESQGESWLFRFPQPLVDLLASATEEQLASANSAWAATEELQWPPAELRPLVSDLQRLAKQSRATGFHMYLWGCL